MLVPACVAMFEEEVGYSPLTGGGQHYRQRVATLIRKGHSLIRRDSHGQVVFKAELGNVSADAVQIQGVWVNPAYRGQGLAAGCMAAVVELSRQYAPVASLYVNDYNHRARGRLRVGRVPAGRHVRHRVVLDPFRQPHRVKDHAGKAVPPCGCRKHARGPSRLEGSCFRGPVLAQAVRNGFLQWFFACPACSCAPCAKTRSTPRWPATSCWCAPATSAVPPRASIPGCRWGCGCWPRSRRRPRGNGRHRRPGSALPGAAAARAVRGDRPLDRVRRGPVPAEGPQGRRLPAGPHARGDVHPAGQGPVLLVQGPAASPCTRSRTSTATRPGPAPACCAAASSS